MNARTHYHETQDAADDDWNTRTAPTVKPLVWGPVIDDFEEDEGATSSAPSPLGRYFAYRYGWWGPGVKISTGATSEPLAQQLANEHNKDAILSALE